MSTIKIDGIVWTVVETTIDSAIMDVHAPGDQTVKQTVAFRLLCERDVPVHS
jgi:hypothetical protein